VVVVGLAREAGFYHGRADEGVPCDGVFRDLGGAVDRKDDRAGVGRGLWRKDSERDDKSMRGGRT